MSLNKYFAAVLFCALFAFGACDDDPCEDFVCEENKATAEDPVTGTCFCICASGFFGPDCTMDLEEFEDSLILEYLAEQGIEGATRTESGLYYIVTEEGSGTSFPTASSDILAAYSGYFLNDIVFDEGEITFGLTDVIPGWTEGFTYFNEGDEGKLLIPSRLAYGPPGRGSIPPNTILAFDVEVISISN